MSTPNDRLPVATPRPSGMDVTLAVARERVAEAHLSNAMAFIEFTAEALAAPRALAIYGRLHHLSEEEFRIVRNRVLASYGDAAGADAAPPPATFVAINGDVEWDVTASLFHRIRNRLGGRRNFRLRKRVELFSGRVEAAILRIHVDSVCRLVRVFDANTPVAEIVRMYMDELEIRRSLYHAIYVGALERLYAEMDAKPEAAAEAAPEAAASAEPPETPPLRMLPKLARRSG